jgi:hypothetical protein
MSNQTAYKFGKLVAANKALASIALVVVLGYIFWPSKPLVEKPIEQAAAVPVAPPKPCANDLNMRIDLAKEKVKANDNEGAFSALDACRSVIKPGSEEEKIYLKAGVALQVAKEKEEAAAKKKELQLWKKEGVSIGMTSERVLLSSWGRPESVNKTTNVNGVREQWVYGSGNYLYFQNGILTSIQN